MRPWTVFYLFFFFAQTGEAWEAVLKPKIRGAANLDMLSRGVPGLDLFVVFSSILTAIGNPGESVWFSGTAHDAW